MPAAPIRRPPKRVERPVGAALALLALAAGGSGCRARPGGPPPSVLLISIDTLRADHLGCYGYGRATSPNLDAFARGGVLFERAYSPSSWTLPAHASMLSGVSPFRHGAVDRERRIREDVPLLAERLRARGYRTAAVVNAPYVHGRYGFARGFERFEEADALKDAAGYQPRVEALLAALEPPFFAFVHYMSVHSPYLPPPGFDVFTRRDGPRPGVDGRRIWELDRQIRAGTRRLSQSDRDHLVALYDGEILALDHVLGRTFDAVARRWPGQVFVVVTSDHGEEFLEHGQIAHGRTLYDEVLHVPLMVQGPGLAAGRRITAPVSLLDLAPTILDMVNGGPAPGLEGQSLVAAARGEDGPRGGFLLPLQTSHHNASVQLRGVRTEEHKLVADDLNGQRAFYDLASDPGERAPRALGPESARLERLLEALRPRPAGAVTGGSREVDEALRALGYH